MAITYTPKVTDYLGRSGSVAVTRDGTPVGVVLIDGTTVTAPTDMPSYVVQSARQALKQALSVGPPPAPADDGRATG